MRANRRTFLAQATALTNTCFFGALTNADESQPEAIDDAPDSTASDRELGLLVGGMLGDALGGPVEFLDAALADAVLPATRKWQPHRRLDA